MKKEDKLTYYYNYCYKQSSGILICSSKCVLYPYNYCLKRDYIGAYKKIIELTMPDSIRCQIEKEVENEQGMAEEKRGMVQC